MHLIINRFFFPLQYLFQKLFISQVFKNDRTKKYYERFKGIYLFQNLQRRPHTRNSFTYFIALL